MSATVTVEGKISTLGVNSGTVKIVMSHGDIQTFMMANSGAMTVRVFPGTGCTISVETSCSHQGEITAGTAEWVEWPPGAVTSDDEQTLSGPVSGLRFTAVGGSCVCEVVI